MANVILKGFIIVPDDDMPGVLEELPNHIALTRQEAGCISFEVSRDRLQRLPRVGVDYAGEAAGWPLRFELSSPCR